MKLLALMVVAALACEKGLKSFSAAVVSGYMGADAFVPMDCYKKLHADTLEEVAIRAFTHFVRGTQEQDSTLQSFTDVIKETLHACEIDTCEADLWSSTQQLKLVINAITTLPKGMELLGNAAAAFGESQWGEMGYSLGEYVKLVKDGDAAGLLFDSLMGPFVKGFALGLERKKGSDSHPCYEEVRSFPKFLIQAIESLYYSYLLDDDTKFDALLASLGDLPSKSYSVCKVQKLVDFVQKVRSGEAMALGTQVMMNLQELKETATVFLTSWGNDWEASGLALGKTARLLTGWSV